MKLNEDVLEERNKIVNSFCIPIRHIPLVASDTTEHRDQLEKVYRGMLHEACVVGNGLRLFEKTFKQIDLYYYE